MDKGVAGLRIAFSPDPDFPVVHPQVAEAMQHGVDELGRAGATITQVALDLAPLCDAMDVIWRAGMAGALRHLTGQEMQTLEPDLLELIVSAQDLTAARLEAAQDSARPLSGHAALLPKL